MITFGCRANQYESGVMRYALRKDYDVVDEDADVILVNACTVTRLADRKARQSARRIRREAPERLIVLVGCLADAVQQGMAQFPEADVIAGTEWKARIDEVVKAALSGVRGWLPPGSPVSLDTERSEGPVKRTRALLRVQDGCAGCCTYCRPTLVRGSPRSKSIAAASAEAKRLTRLGFPEIVLTGINLAQYAPPDGRLHDLIRVLLTDPELRRLRIASLNPAGLTDALADAFLADDRLCPHLHVPLQSGDNRVLRAMRRGYTFSEYEETIDRIRQRLPELTFGTDVIVGFPGEDEAAFERTCDVVEHLAPINLHAFRYSPRPGTEAAALTERVPEGIKRARADRLQAVWRPIRRKLLDKRVGTIQDVLVEVNDDGRWQGYTRDYIYVSFDSANPMSLGAEHPVWIVKATEGGLEGEWDDRDGTG